MKIEFSVSGNVKQEVTMFDDTITVEELEAGLKSGKFATTIQEDGKVVIVEDQTPIGKVEWCDNECEYFDYNVSE